MGCKVSKDISHLQCEYCGAFHRPPCTRARPNDLVPQLKEKLRIATECLKDVRSELTHAKHNIDEQWCIDQICAALAAIADGVTEQSEGRKLK